jgi:hypothetical protein
MKSPGRVLVDSRAAAAGLFVGAAVWVGLGCMNLDKPKAVEDCIAAGSCRNGPPAPTSDARDVADDVAEPDLRPPDEPVGSKKDLGPDQPTEPDARPGDPDSPSGDRDASGSEPRVRDVSGPSDLGHDAGSDARVVAEGPSDRGRDRETGGEPDREDAPADVGKEDVAKEDVAKEDVIKADVVREDVTKDDVTKDDVVKDDVVKEDIPGPEAPADLPTDTGASNCTMFFGSSPPTGTKGHPPQIGKDAACIATCDDIAGWGCANADGRTVTLNGVTVKCNDSGNPTVAKKDGYYVFKLGAGTNQFFDIYWWVNNESWATTCNAPAGGF